MHTSTHTFQNNLSMFQNCLSNIFKNKKELNSLGDNLMTLRYLPILTGQMKQIFLKTKVQLRLQVKKYKNTIRILEIKKPNNKVLSVIKAKVYQMRKVSIWNSFPSLLRPK